MRLFTTVAGLRCYLAQQRQTRAVDGIAPEIGFIPTMGALHLGHLSLMQRARQENGFVVVSIFVNPLQFAPNEDFQAYPRTLEQDQLLCEDAGIDVLFLPTAAELGIQRLGVQVPGVRGQVSGEEPETRSLEPGTCSLTQVVPPPQLIAGLCGRSRPGHFQGVATIVTKLLNLVQPDRAYFGQKDAQQLVVIQQLVADLNLPVEIVPCGIVREASGLALSSRNQYLSVQEREQAAVLYRSLQQAVQVFRSGERTASKLIAAVMQELASVPAVIPEYVELVDPVTLATLEVVTDAGLLAIAARLGITRLIDNVTLRTRQPIIAIDGPAGAGKSTVTKLIAEKLGLLHLDTGSMYRAVTWLVWQSGIPLEDEAAIAELVSQCEIQVSGVRCQVSGVRCQVSEASPETWNLEPETQTLEPETQTLEPETWNLKPNFQVSEASPEPQTLEPETWNLEPETQTLEPETWNLKPNSSRIVINGQDVTEAIRSPEVTAMVSAVSAQPAVRRLLVQAQRHYGRNGGIVAEGRDIGTHVFPDAELKIFLTASVEERARRRQQDFQQQGKPDVNLAELKTTIAARDHHDSTRRVSPLRKAIDAIEIQTDHVTIDSVVEQVVCLYRAIAP